MSAPHGRWYGWLATVLLVTGAALAAGKKPPKPSKPAPAASASEVLPPGPKPLAETLMGDAKAHYDAAKLLYGDGDWEGALVKFRAAYDSSKDARLLWNMAACEKSLRHYAKVLGLLTRYVQEGGALLTEQDRKDAKDLLTAIEAFTSSLTLIVNEAGAEVVIDDEPVGTTPLPGPVVVDIGMRRVQVRKPGFREYAVSMPVGGSKDVRQYVVLEKEVHEGRVTVHAPKGAEIFIDGAPVGLGAWDGTLPSGGHTLRVTAAGMRPYQSETVVQDGDKRTIEVALEPIGPSGPVEEEHGALYGMEIGLRTGYGIVKHPDPPNAKFVPFAFDLGYRVGRPTFFGLFVQGGPFDRSETCGVAVHGPEPSSPTDLSTRYAPSSCWFAKLGLSLVFHTLPRTIVDPWFGFDVGFQHSEYQFMTYDPPTKTSGETHAKGDFPLVGLQLGLDAHPTPHLGVGPFTEVALLVGTDGTLSGDSQNSFLANRVCSSGGSCPNSNNGSDQGGGKANVTVLGGLRAAYTF